MEPKDRPIAWILILIALAVALALAVAVKGAPQASAPPAGAIACGGCIINDPPPPPPPYWPPKLLFFPLFRNQPADPAGETGEAVEWTPTPEEEIGPPASWTATPAALALASATPTPGRYCSPYAPASWTNPRCTHPADDPAAYATDVAGRQYVATAYPRPAQPRGIQPAVMPTRRSNPHAGAAPRPTPTPRR